MKLTREVVVRVDSDRARQDNDPWALREGAENFVGEVRYVPHGKITALSIFYLLALTNAAAYVWSLVP